MRILRYPLAVVLGLIGIGIGVGLLEFASHLVFPPDPELQDLILRLTDSIRAGDAASVEAVRVQLAAKWQSVPMGAYIGLILSWTGGAVVGGGLAALTAPAGRLWFAMAMGLLDAAAIVYNGLLLEPPSWLAPVGVVSVLIAAAAVGWCVVRWTARRSGDARTAPAGTR